MNNKEIAQKWFVFGNKDLKTAEFLLDMKPLPIEIICYHCNQSAQKYLKGYIAINGGNTLIDGNLSTINKVCCQYNEKFCEIDSNCQELDKYAEYSTCPANINIEKYDDMKVALVNANNIEMFINKLFA